MGDGLESDVISLEWRSLSWAFCHFYIILQYQRVQARALKQAGRHKREPLFLEVSSRTSSSPIVGRRSTTQQPRETNVCHVCCHAAVMLPVCETFLSALADAAAEDAQAPVCLFPPTGSHLPTGSKPAAPSLVALSF